MNRAVLLLILCALTASAQGGRDRRRFKSPATMTPLALSNLAQEQVPLLKSGIQGWALTGSKPDAYEVRCDEIQSACAIPILRTKLGAAEPLGTGSLTHVESAVPWRGKKVELRAELRAGRIDGWAGLWVRIDDANGEVLAFDNMQDRAVRGTGSFEWQRVVLEVPANAERISLGLLLRGPGAVFIRELQFEEAEPNAASTDLLKLLKPQSDSMISKVGEAASQQQPVSGTTESQKKAEPGQ